MNTSFCHLLISFFVVSCNPFEYTFRASYLFLFWRKGTPSPQILMEIQ